jgi:hypothetical protein
MQGWQRIWCNVAEACLDVDHDQIFGGHIDMSEIDPHPSSGYAWLDEHTGRRKKPLASMYQ